MNHRLLPALFLAKYLHFIAAGLVRNGAGRLAGALAAGLAFAAARVRAAADHGPGNGFDVLHCQPPHNFIIIVIQHARRLRKRFAPRPAPPRHILTRVIDPPTLLC
jgi:hypothetical protein